MEEFDDFFDEIGALALGSRLKRLSDKLYSDAQSVYKAFNLPVNPKWFTLLALLHEKQQVHIVEAAQRLRLSQPAVSQFSKQLAEQSLVEIVAEQTDSRKRIISLTAQGKVVVSNMQAVWQGIEHAAKQLCYESGNDFYGSLLRFEKALDRQSLLVRSKVQMEALYPSNTLSFIPFSEDLSAFFEVINIQWIEAMFKVEDIDRKVLKNPKKYIIDQGGYIWFAKHPLHGIVGTCALMKTGKNEFELTKMGVLPASRGVKIGEQLLQHVIDSSMKIGIQKLYLLTNKKCEAAIHLYNKLGFEHDKTIMEEFGSHYDRCDVAMLYKPS